MRNGEWTFRCWYSKVHYDRSSTVHLEVIENQNRMTWPGVRGIQRFLRRGGLGAPEIVKGCHPGIQMNPADPNQDFEDERKLLEDLYKLLEAYAPTWYSLELRQRLLRALNRDAGTLE